MKKAIILFTVTVSVLLSMPNTASAGKSLKVKTMRVVDEETIEYIGQPRPDSPQPHSIYPTATI